MDEQEKMRNMKLQVQNKLLENYRRLNAFAKKGAIVLAGSSLMEHFPVNELLMSMESDLTVYNRGIGGYISDQLLENIRPLILDLQPAQLYINIGTNDLGRPGDYMGHMLGNYREILRLVKQELPACRITMLAFYPVTDVPAEQRPMGAPFRTREMVQQANLCLQQLAREMQCAYADLNAPITTPDGYLKPELACDHIHMWPDAYAMLLKELLVLFKQ